MVLDPRVTAEVAAGQPEIETRSRHFSGLKPGRTVYSRTVHSWRVKVCFYVQEHVHLSFSLDFILVNPLLHYRPDSAPAVMVKF